MGATSSKSKMPTKKPGLLRLEISGLWTAAKMQKPAADLSRPWCMVLTKKLLMEKSWVAIQKRPFHLWTGSEQDSLDALVDKIPLEIKLSTDVAIKPGLYEQQTSGMGFTCNQRFHQDSYLASLLSITCWA
jgi:hypothetical protein